MSPSSIRSFFLSRPRLALFLKVALWGVVLFGLWQALHDPYKTQWDFKLYLSCSKAQGLGINPYDDMALTKGLGYYWRMPCLYPPLVNAAYRPFVWISPEQKQYGSQILYTLLKIAMAGGLLALWRRKFVELRHEVPVLLFFLLAFGNPLYVDIRAGNVAVLEQLLLWSGFAFWLSGRDLWFSVCVILAAQAKLTPAAFLVLLLARPKPRWLAFAAACAGFYAVFSLNKLFYPALTQAYFDKLVSTSDVWANESGTINCATSAFVRDLLAVFGVALSDLTRAKLMLGIDAAIFAAGVWACWPLLKRDDEEARLELVFFAVVVQTLLSPRLKDYSYAAMLPPTFYVLTRCASNGRRAALLLLVCVNSLKGLGVKLGLGPAAALLSYFKWYALALVWLELSRLRFSARPVSAPAPSPSARL